MLQMLLNTAIAITGALAYFNPLWYDAQTALAHLAAFLQIYISNGVG